MVGIDDGRPEPHAPPAGGARHRLAAEVEVAKLLIYRVLAAANKGQVPNVEATMSKLWATQLSQRLANTAVDLLGLYGQLSKGSPYAVQDGRWELLHRSMVNMTIGGGSSEVQKNIVARRALGLP